MKNMVIVVAMLILSVAYTAKVHAQEYTPDANTVALYHFSETSGTTVSDASGNGNHGTATGTTIVDGKFGKARSFNGSSDYLSILHSTSLIPTSQITVEGWFLFNSFSQVMSLIDKRETNSEPQAGYLLWYENTGDSVYFQLSVANTRLWITFNRSSAGMLSGTWYHIAGSYDGNIMRLYLNGIQETALATSGGAITQSNGLLVLGRKSFENYYYLDGKMDEIRISNKAREPWEFNGSLGFPSQSYWKYSMIYQPGWNTPSFDDNAWSEAPAAFGYQGWCPLPVNTNWLPNTVLYLRKHFTLPTQNSMRAYVAIDNDFTWWLNGDSLYSATHEGCASRWSDQFITPSASSRVGDNVVAVKAMDRGDNTFFDARLESNEYYLKRTLQGGIVENFDMSKHAWSFGNADGIVWSNPPNYANAFMWPQSWWNQFDYTRPPYPFGWQFWPVNARANDFPDWLLFADAFGKEQCYWIPPPGHIIYNPLAVLRWTQDKGEWGGSCFGFATTAFLFFDNQLSVSSSFPGHSSLYTVPIQDESRKLINKYHLYQYGRVQQQHIDNNFKKTPAATLDDIKQMFLSTERNDRILELWNEEKGGGHHAVNPYRVSVGLNVDTVYIYDNNWPNVRSYILIDKTFNAGKGRWDYPFRDPAWSGTKGLFLMNPMSDYVSNPILPKNIPPSEKWASLQTTSNNYIQIFNTSSVNILLKDSSGKRIGYEDSLVLNELEHGHPIVPCTGFPHPPIGYYLPQGNYSIQMDHFTDSSLIFSVFSDSLAYFYSRADANITQTDFLTYADDLSVGHHDNQAKKVTLGAIIVEESNEKVFNVMNLAFSQDDSLSINTVDHKDLKISNNFGVGRTYDLRIESASANGDSIFGHKGIDLPINSSHEIAPTWDSLTDKAVTIFVDNGNNGSVDDTLHIQNQFFSFPMSKRWNIVSLPLIVEDSHKDVLFPTAVSKAFAYVPHQGYTTQDTFRRGTGYWLKFKDYQSVPIYGDPITVDTISVMRGWNLIGSVNKEIAANTISSIPSGIISPSLFGYDNGYTLAGTLMPGKGYWIKAYDSGKIILSFSGLAKSEQGTFLSDKLGEFNTLTIRDAAGSQQTLYFGMVLNKTISRDVMELPPIPPTGIFDARFASDRFIELIDDGKSDEYPISISAGIYPLDISWEVRKKDISSSLKIGNQAIRLDGVGNIEVSNSKAGIALVLTGVFSIPEQFALEQNFPNPFNPSTVIKYKLPVKSEVTLKIFNVLGQEVKTLVDEIQEAGYQSKEWNASALASGVYFYRLEATSISDPTKSFTQVKKMLLMK